MDYSIRPLCPRDIPALSDLDLEIRSTCVLSVAKEVDGLAVTWRLEPRQLATPFCSTGFAPTPHDWEELGRNLQAGRREGYVVEVTGGPVGMIALGVEAWRNVGVVWDLLLDRPYRRQGMGTVLVQAAIAWGRERGLRALVLETQTNNWDALNFYRTMGFEPCGIDDHFYTNRDREAGEVALFWVYELMDNDDE